MSKHLRNSHECENCGYNQVTMAYCPKCGQHNVETRQSFGHLVAHFAEDFTHYDSGFWKTIKHLLFRPARLTKEYLMGKRQEYVPPVKLYIFISFITFLLPALLPDFNKSKENDSAFIEIKTNEREEIFEQDYIFTTFHGHEVSSIQQLDSLYTNKTIGKIDYKITKSFFKIRDNRVTNNQLFNLILKLTPKVLFFYLPVFAFWLWLFHGKKRWYFFDHGIFTLHYFSFLLLSFTIIYVFIYILESIFGYGSSQANALWVIFVGYSFFYFFRSHRRMYGESRFISRLKSLSLFIINIVSVLIALLITTLYIFITYH